MSTPLSGSAASIGYVRLTNSGTFHWNQSKRHQCYLGKESRHAVLFKQFNRFCCIRAILYKKFLLILQRSARQYEEC